MKIRNYATILGVEIFATGKHNGETYTEADLDAMVNAFKELDFAPAIKAGHTDAPGTPALGYIANLQRVGNKLVSDFVDVPDEVATQIRDKKFNRVSSEIYFNLERAGKKFSRALKAVALLGAEVPGVAGLKPLSACFAEISAECRNYDFAIFEPTEGNQDMNEAEVKKLVADSVAAALTTSAAATATAVKEAVESTTANLTKEFNQKISTLSSAQRDATVNILVGECKIPAFRTALRALAMIASDQPAEKKYALAEKGADGKDAPTGDAVEVVRSLIAQINAKATKLFLAHSTSAGNGADKFGTANGGEGGDNEVGQYAEATQAELSDAVDGKVKAYMATNKEKDYRAAMNAVLADPANAELAEEYRNIRDHKAA